MEETFEVKPIGVKYICDTCEKGELLPTGENSWSQEIPNIEHGCTNCESKKMLPEKYPLIRYTRLKGY